MKNYDYQEEAKKTIQTCEYGKFDGEEDFKNESYLFYSLLVDGVKIVGFSDEYIKSYMEGFEEAKKKFEGDEEDECEENEEDIERLYKEEFKIFMENF